jgi:hypothetical protein
MKKIFAFAAVALFAANVQAATVSTSKTLGTTSPEAVAAGAPAQADVYKFFTTTSADILSIDNIKVTLGSGSLFQVAPPFGSDTAAPDPAFVGLNRALEADTWITTPGATSLLGTGLPGDGTGSWGDLVDNGAQNNFQFATLTVPKGTVGSFAGRINVAGSAGPENFAFNFTLGVPEPASMALAGMGLIGLMSIRRRNA